MPANPTFKASYAEWRTVIDALRYYADHLAATAPNIADEDQHLIAYDEMERLDRILPSFERQFNDCMAQISASLDQPVPYPAITKSSSSSERANS